MKLLFKIFGNKRKDELSEKLEENNKKIAAFEEYLKVALGTSKKEK